MKIVASSIPKDLFIHRNEDASICDVYPHLEILSALGRVKLPPRSGDIF